MQHALRLQHHDCFELTSLQAAVERNGLALICAAGMRARVTLQWAGGVPPSISAPAQS